MRILQKVTLLIFFFSINFEVWDPFSIGFLSISKLIGLMYLISVIPNFSQFFRIGDIKSFLKPIWLFFGLLTIVSIININSVSANFFNFSIFQTIILFWILINHERREPRILEKGLISFGIGSIMLALLYTFNIGVEYEDGRVNLFGDNANTVGIRMCVSVFVLLFTALQNRVDLNKLRYFLLLPIPIMLKLMAETGSRVAFLSFFSMFIVAMALIKTKKRRYKIAIYIAGLLLLLTAFLYIIQSEIIMIRLLQTKETGNVAGRDVIWESIFPLIKNNPIFGVGETGYRLYTQHVFGGEKSPHNVILEILCYTGIVGLLIYLTFFFKVCKQGYVSYKRSGVLLQVLLLIPITGLLLSGQLLYSKIGWIIFAYIVSGSLNDSKSKNLEKKLNSI